MPKPLAVLFSVAAAIPVLAGGPTYKELTSNPEFQQTQVRPSVNEKGTANLHTMVFEKKGLDWAFRFSQDVFAKKADGTIVLQNGAGAVLNFFIVTCKKEKGDDGRSSRAIAALQDGVMWLGPSLGKNTARIIDDYLESRKSSEEKKEETVKPGETKAGVPQCMLLKETDVIRLVVMLP